MRRTLLQTASAFLLQNAAILLQNAELLRSTTFITKCVTTLHLNLN